MVNEGTGSAKNIVMKFERVRDALEPEPVPPVFLAVTCTV